MSQKSVLQECQVRVSSQKGVLQECHLSVSRQGVPQVGSLENVISIVSVLQHTCRHSGSWASSCFNIRTSRNRPFFEGLNFRFFGGFHFTSGQGGLKEKQKWDGSNRIKKIHQKS